MFPLTYAGVKVLPQRWNPWARVVASIPVTLLVLYGLTWLMVHSISPRPI
jgi:hypothetical protein